MLCGGKKGAAVAARRANGENGGDGEKGSDGQLMLVLARLAYFGVDSIPLIHSSMNLFTSIRIKLKSTVVHDCS